MINGTKILDPYFQSYDKLIHPENFDIFDTFFFFFSSVKKKIPILNISLFPLAKFHFEMSFALFFLHQLKDNFQFTTFPFFYWRSSTSIFFFHCSLFADSNQSLHLKHFHFSISELSLSFFFSIVLCSLSTINLSI